MPGPKTNERDGTRAVLRHARVSPYKVREVLNLVRGKPVHEAEDILRFSERDAAFIVGKVLRSAVANAENNDELDPEELYVAACFADEGNTIKRWRPRARGRATRIRKRTSHITIIVSRLPDRELVRLQARRRSEQLVQRARRVAGARRSEGDTRSRAERRHGGAVPEPDELEETTADETTADDATAGEVTGEATEAEATASGAPAAEQDEAEDAAVADDTEVEGAEQATDATEQAAGTTEAEAPEADAAARATGSDETTDADPPAGDATPGQEEKDVE
jgi:large subunit ribosomal protein L22